MTVGAIIGIIVCVIMLIVCIVGGIFLITDDTVAGGVTLLSAGILIWVPIICGICFWQFNTESGARAIKDQNSNFNGGIERIVKVYDVNGELIEKYEGKFDVDCKTDTNTPYIVFDDNNGKRHMIFYTTGTLIIDEK